MNPEEKPLARFKGVQVRTPPMGEKARREAGFLLGRIQGGEVLEMPQARALFSVAPGLYELRIREADKNWRVFYRVDQDRVLLIHQINKTTRTLPDKDKKLIVSRLASYDAAKAGETQEDTSK